MAGSASHVLQPFSPFPLLNGRRLDFSGISPFDNRSFRLNFEITLQFAGREFTDQVAAMLEQDFANARAVSSAELEAKGFWFRFAARAARLAAPIQ
jgi:cardiolipin synthase